VNQPIFANTIPAIPLDPAQQLLPSHLWCKSMVIPAFSCQRTMCNSLCRYNHTLPAWRKDGQLLSSALLSIGITPPELTVPDHRTNWNWSRYTHAVLCRRLLHG
jgi:hypothetical protein